MRDTLSVLARLLPAFGLCLSIAAGSGCASKAAEVTDDSGASDTAPSAGTVKFHVVPRTDLLPMAASWRLRWSAGRCSEAADPKGRERRCDCDRLCS